MNRRPSNSARSPLGRSEMTADQGSLRYLPVGALRLWGSFAGRGSLTWEVRSLPRRTVETPDMDPDRPVERQEQGGTESTFSQLLRQGRVRRWMSQLDLAVEAEVSSRHV